MVKFSIASTSGVIETGVEVAPFANVTLAGTENLSVSPAATTGTVSSSICPKNWKLPSNSGDGSFTDLLEHAGITNNQEGANKIQGAPYNFSRAGNFEGSGKMSDDYGFYWSNSAKGVFVINSARVFLFTGSISTDPNVSTSRVVGQSVRCVALGN